MWGPRSARNGIQAARRVVQVAEQRQADFLLVAGDTFEDNAVDRLLVQKIADVLGGFSRPVYFIPGNHDPLVPGSVWEHPAWSSHPQIQIIGTPTAIEIPGGTLYSVRSPKSIRLAIRPLGSTPGPTSASPWAWLTARAAGILCRTRLDYPIPRHAAARSRLDYLALGHWHSTATYPGNGEPVSMAYSGTHETTKFGERDSGNVLLVEIASRRSPPKITSLRTGGLRWAIQEAKIHPAR